MKTGVLALLFVCCWLVASQESTEVDRREICEDESTCDTICDGNDCSYCSGGNCCQTVNCNSCVNNCRSACSNSACANNCVNSCASSSCNTCNSCRTRSCRKSCNKCTSSKQIQETIQPPSTHHSNTNNSISNTSQTNITTTIDLLNQINNTNIVHIPVYVNSSNINTIELKHDPYPSKEVEIIKIKENRTEKQEDKSCCMVIPPKTCNYETKELKCQQNPYKSCSPICKSPVVVPHPVPVYIPRPYPVPVRVPYPVNHTQIKYVQVPVPHPIQVPVPITRVVKEPVYIPQHIPYPVREKVLVPQPVPRPYPVPIVKPLVITQNVPQPIVIPKIIEVPKYIQQPCPMVYFQGQQMPSCSNAMQAQQYVGTSQKFLIDQFSERLSYPVMPQCTVTNKYPWLTCNNVQVESCGKCSFCNGRFNPNCIFSRDCPASCSRTIQNLHLQNQIGRNLVCGLSSKGEYTCS